MKLIIDISKDRYDEIMAMDWKNCRLIFDEEIRAIHDGKALEQEPCGDCISREAVMHILDEVGGDFDSPREAVVPIDYIADMVSELPSVTLQPCDDCISRQAVLEGLASIAKAKAKSDTQKSLMGRAMYFVEQFPSVTPMSKTGIDWITEENPEDADAYLVTWEHPRYKGSRFIGICEWDGERWLVEEMEQSKLYKETLIILAWSDPEPYMGWKETK